MKQDVEDPEEFRKEAERLSNLLGDKYIREFEAKMNEILYGC